MERYVAYYRVSTEQQGKSGLGLEAQRAAVLAFVGEQELIAEHTDIESGKVNDRPALKQALSQARMAGATLVLASRCEPPGSVALAAAFCRGRR